MQSWLYAQPFWFERSGGVSNDEALDITNDPSGNVIATGYFTQGADFSGTTLSTASISDVFVAKYDNAGVLLWAKQCGGAGADRGLSVRTDGSGNIYVTGYFSGMASFGSTTLVSAGSQDIFVTKLDAAGNFIWAKSMGGPQADYGNGITTDNSGNVVVTGQFKDTADFGSGITLTGMINPATGLTTYDIFVAKFDVSGNTLWAKGAHAIYDDRGMDVDCDASGNIYVTGQFSDTLVLDVVHNNNTFNAGFLFRLDAMGNETGFCHMTAGQSMAYSIDVDPLGNINICGDYTGSLLIHAASPVFVPSPSLKNIFVLRFNASLDVVWAAHAGSASEVSARSIITDALGHVWIAGIYRCRMDDFGAPYGTGMFYSMGYRDIFMAEFDQAGNFIRAKNAGSPKDDFCSGITLSATNTPVLAGGMNNRFHYVGIHPFYPIGIYSYSACDSLGQGQTTMVSPNQQRDIFVGAIMDTTNLLVDAFWRMPYSCTNSDLLLPEIGGMAGGIYNDSVVFCGGGNIIGAHVQTFYPGTGGPTYNYTWQDGSTSDYIYANTTGWYFVDVQREDGCYSNIDSLYVLIDPAAPPLVTDSYGVNVLHPPNSETINICGSDTITLTASNVEGPLSHWTDPAGSFIQVNDSVINIYHAGIYYFTNINENGCTVSNMIHVVMDTFAITDTLHPFLLFNQSANDTIHICPNGYIFVSLNDTLYYDGSVMFYKPVEWFIDSLDNHTNDTYIYEYITHTPDSTGWITFFAHLINNCAQDTMSYWIQDSVYVIVDPPPPISYTFIPQTLVCPYDTLTHVFYTNASVNLITNVPYHWLGDSVLYTLGSGYLFFELYNTDSVTGCTNYVFFDYDIPDYPYPEVTMMPTEGVVCPNDSVLLSVTPGISYQWIGDGMDSTNNGPAAYASTAGFYYCAVTDSNGCTLASNVVEVNEYSTPFIQAEPDVYFCQGDEVTLSVQASPGAVYNWQSPLSGSSPTQVVNAGGTYICEVTSCGILTISSVVLVMTEVPVEITASDTLMCSGDTVRLSANQGMAEYLWTPSGSGDTVIQVTNPGNYMLTVLYNGCYNSATVTIGAQPITPSPVISAQNVCPGQPATLTASGLPLISWYDSSNTLVATGASYTTPPILYDVTYYVQAVSAPDCPSPLVPATVLVVNDTLPVLSYSPVCEGKDLHLSSNVTLPASFYWSGPGAFTSTASNPVIAPVTLASSGVYAMYYSSGPGCMSDSAFIAVNVFSNPVPVIIDSLDQFCEDQTVFFQAQPMAGAQFTWYFANGDSITGNPASTVIEPGHNGTVVLVLTDSLGCKGDDTLTINVGSLPVISFTLTNELCVGDTLFMSGSVAPVLPFIIMGPGGFISTAAPVSIPGASGLNDGVYVMISDYNGCVDSVFQTVNVVESPPVSLGADTGLCSGASIGFNFPGQYGYLWNDGSALSNFTITQPGSFWVTVTDTSGCSITDTLLVEALNCEIAFPNIFTPNGDGINDYFRPLSEGMINLEMTIFNRWGNLIFKTNNIDGKWNGADMNGEEVSAGVYFYVAHVKVQNGQESNVRGTVQLSR